MDIYGVIGYPIKHSLSPAMHNAAFKELGMDAAYRTFEVTPEGLEDFLLNKEEVIGFNITVPHKLRAKEILGRQKNVIESDMHYVDLCGAVNTLRRMDSGFKYTNTDVLGFLTSLDRDLSFDYRDKNILLIGCGGAGRAVIAGMAYGDRCSRKLYIYDNTPTSVRSAQEFFSRFSYLKGSLEFIPEERIAVIIRDCQLMVNASPVGMREGDEPVIDAGFLHKGLSVYDIVYNRETELIKDARSLGLPAASGIGMLLYQGAHAFEFWTDKPAPIDVMRKALNKALT